MRLNCLYLFGDLSLELFVSAPLYSGPVVTEAKNSCTTKITRLLECYSYCAHIILIMRLLKLDDNGRFSLVSFAKGEIPSYAILSHTWDRGEDDEVTFRDIMDGAGHDKKGFQKLQFCSIQAKVDKLYYCWVDTCCIDKSNEKELTTAINSMFRWYQNAAICYVYLSDVSVYRQDDQVLHKEWKSAFYNSRWFTRGWTLQELLAPKVVVFYSCDHTRLGDKRSLEQIICEITGIAVEALQGRSLNNFSVQERFRWKETRQTTEEEDIAYCMLGIFDVSMPLVYGEGQEKAISRLRREIEAFHQNGSQLSGEQ